jgi:hypothetical protein
VFPTIFEKEAGFVVPKINSEAAWVFTDPSIAYRQYDGQTVLLKRSWIFWKKWYARHHLIPGSWVPTKELEIQEKLSRALEYPPLEHDFLGSGKYKPGYYELVNDYRVPRLVGENNEQAGNVNSMEIHFNEDVEDVFYSLARSLANSGYRGVLFKSRQKDDKVAQLLRKDFDWNGIAQSNRGRDYGLSKMPIWEDNERQE